MWVQAWRLLEQFRVVTYNGTVKPGAHPDLSSIRVRVIVDVSFMRVWVTGTVVKDYLLSLSFAVSDICNSLLQDISHV